jgi:hypothetical protein
MKLPKGNSRKNHAIFGYGPFIANPAKNMYLCVAKIRKE